MAENGKLRLLKIMEYMKNTDENHPLNSTQIMEKLEKGTPSISAERKVIGRDIQALIEAGYQIEKCPNHNDGYYMIEHEFEDYQLKILADLVAFSRFINIEDSRELIKKIKTLATPDGVRLIDATLVMDPSIKVQDKKFKLKYDAITRALLEHKMITFKYGDYEAKSKKVDRYHGWTYKISPYYLVMWGPEFYVIGNIPKYKNASHYKLEMMSDVEIAEEDCKPISQVEILKDIGKSGYTIEDYVREKVHAYNGKKHSVTITGVNHIRQEVMRKYGYDLMFMDMPDNRFKVNFNVEGTEGLYQWLAKYGINVKLVSPAKDVEGYKEYLKEVLELY